MRRLQTSALVVLGIFDFAYAGRAHDLITTPVQLQSQCVAQPVGPMMFEPMGDGTSPRSGTMSFDRSTEVELVFENIHRLLAQGDHASAVPLLQEALDVVVNDKILQGEIYRHPWFHAMNLMRSFPAEGQVLIERFAGARANASLQRSWRENDLRAIERIAIQFRFTQAGRQALRLLAGCAMDDGDYRFASAWYARLFEEEHDPLQAAAQDPGSLLNWLMCEARLENAEGISRIWQRYQPAVATKLILAHGESVSLQSWLTDQGLLPTSLPTGNAATPELTSLIPAGGAEWTTPTEDAGELQEGSISVLELLGDYDLSAMHASCTQVVGDRLLVSSIGGLTCLNLATGEVVWRKEFDTPSSPSGAESGSLTLTRRSVGGGLYDQFACDGSTVYYLVEDPAIHSMSEGTIRRRNRLVACDLATGEIRWELMDARIAGDRRARVVSQYFLSAPLVDGPRLYILGQESFQGEDGVHLLMLDAQTSEMVSLIELGPTPRSLAMDLHRQEFSGRIALQGELVICATGWGSVMGVDPAARAVRWAHAFPRLNVHAVQTANFYSGYGMVSEIGWEWWRGWRGVTLEPAGDLTIFASPETDRLIAYDYRSGEIAWEHPRGFGRYVAAVLSDRVLVASTNGVEAFDLATGRPLWNAETPPIVGKGFTTGGIHIAPVGDNGCVAIDVADGRLVFQSRQKPQVLSPATVGPAVVYEPASLMRHGDVLLRVTRTGVSRLQSLSQLSSAIAIENDATPELLLQQAFLHEDLGETDEADRILESLIQGEPDISDLAEEARAEMLMRQLLQGVSLSADQEAFLRGSQFGKDYVPLLLHRRLAALTADGDATALSAADATAMIDDILSLMADAPEREFFNAPHGRRVRLDRYLQGAILTLLERVEESSRGELEQHIADELQEQFRSADSPRRLWQWIVRSDRLPWGQAQAVQPSSIAGLTGGEQLLREMLLWELSQTKDPAIASQAVLRLAELPSSRADGVPELLLQRISRHLDLALDDGRLIRDVIQTAGHETAWPIAFERTDASFWPVETPEVTEDSGPFGNIHSRIVRVAPSFPAPLARFNVEVVPPGGTPDFVRFGGGVKQFWSEGIPSLPRLKEYVPNPYVTDQPELIRGWNVGPVIYLQVGAGLVAYRPFNDEGEPEASFAWPRQMGISSIGDADFSIAETMLNRRNGVRDTEMIYSDSFGYRVDQFGPFQSNFFCTPETGDLVVRSSATGRELWSMPVTSSSHWLANDEAVVIYDDQSWQFAVHRAVDGELLATHALPARPLDTLQSAGTTLLLDLPVENPESAAISQLVAWNAVAGAAAWSYPITSTTLPFLVDQQLVGVIDSVTEQMELIDISTGAVVCTHLPDQPDQVQNVHCIVDADQVIVIVTRAGGEVESPISRDPRVIPVNGTLHAFDRHGGSWMWTRHVKDIDIHLDQPNHIPLLVMHQNSYLIEDPFAFSEMPAMQTKLRFAVLDRRTGDMLVDEMLEYARAEPLQVKVDVDIEGRTVSLRTNAGTGFRFDYLPAE